MSLKSKVLILAVAFASHASAFNQIDKFGESPQDCPFGVIDEVPNAQGSTTYVCMSKAQAETLEGEEMFSEELVQCETEHATAVVGIESDKKSIGILVTYPAGEVESSDYYTMDTSAIENYADFIRGEDKWFVLAENPKAAATQIIVVNKPGRGNSIISFDGVSKTATCTEK